MNPFPIDQIIESFEGRLSLQEQEKLDFWLTESNENQIHYNELKKVFETTGKIKINFQPDEYMALKKVNRRLNSKRIIRWVQASAAAVLLFFVVTKVILFISPEPKWHEMTATSRQVIFLPDSSKIILAENSHLKFPDKFSKKERIVFLQGRAYFEITTNKKLPFLINTLNARIEVLGTKFMVDAVNPKQEWVVVDEGKVAFGPVNSTPDKSVILVKNEIGVWDIAGNKITTRENYDINYNSWLSGRLSFYDTPLKQVINDFARYFHIKIELGDQSLESRKYTGSFIDAKPEKALEILCFSLNISVDKIGNKFIIMP